MKHMHKVLSVLIILTIVGISKVHAKTNDSSSSVEAMQVQVQILLEKIKELQQLAGNTVATTKLESTRPSVTFNAPYPLVWKDVNNTPNFGGSGKFSLTGVAIEDIIIDADTHTALWTGFDYQNYTKGQKVRALVLHFKINVITGGMMPRSVRLVNIEGGEIDKIAPPHRDYLYPNHKPSNDFLLTDTTITDARVFFPISKTQNEFIVTTGGKDETYLKIILVNNQLSVERLALKNLPSFTKSFTAGTDISPVVLTLKREGSKLTAVLVEKSRASSFLGILKNDGSFTLTNQQSITKKNPIKKISGNLLSTNENMEIKLYQSSGTPKSMQFKVYINK